MNGTEEKRRKNRHLRTSWLLGLLSVSAILILWQTVTYLGVFPELFVPRPKAVVESFVQIATVGYRGATLAEHLATSLFRVLFGFGLALITAVPIGLAMGYNRVVRGLLDPIIEFYRPLPPLAYYTILVVWLGIENESKIALLFLAAFPPLSISAMSGVRGISPDRIHGALSLGASHRQVFLHVVLPSCLPDVFTGIRVSIGFTYTTLVSAEIVAATSGIGWMVLDASKFLRSDVIFMGIIVMGLTGLLLDRLVRLVEARVVPWKGK